MQKQDDQQQSYFQGSAESDESEFSGEPECDNSVSSSCKRCCTVPDFCKECCKDPYILALKRAIFEHDHFSKAYYLSILLEDAEEYGDDEAVEQFGKLLRLTPLRPDQVQTLSDYLTGAGHSLRPLTQINKKEIRVD